MSIVCKLGKDIKAVIWEVTLLEIRVIEFNELQAYKTWMSCFQVALLTSLPRGLFSLIALPQWRVCLSQFIPQTGPQPLTELALNQVLRLGRTHESFLTECFTEDTCFRVAFLGRKRPLRIETHHKSSSCRNTLPSRNEVDSQEESLESAGPRVGVGEAEAIFRPWCRLLTGISVSGRRRAGPLDCVLQPTSQELLADEGSFLQRKTYCPDE